MSPFIQEPGPRSQRCRGQVVSSLAEFQRIYGGGPTVPWPESARRASSYHWGSQSALDAAGPEFAGVPSVLVERYGASYSITLAEPKGFALWGARRRWAQIGGDWDRQVTARRRDRAAAAAKGWLTEAWEAWGSWHNHHVHVTVAGRKLIHDMSVLGGLREMGKMADAIWNED